MNHFSRSHVVFALCCAFSAASTAAVSSEEQDPLTEALNTVYQIAMSDPAGRPTTSDIRGCFVAVDGLLKLSPEGGEGELLRNIAKLLEPLCLTGPTSRLEAMGLLYLLEQSDFDIQSVTLRFADPANSPKEAELDALRLAVAQCWNVGALSSEALAASVTVSFTIGEDGRLSGDISLKDGSGARDVSIRMAFETVRRAILRCSVQAFGVTSGEYELTFDLSTMRVR